uniref:Uncharacterized protein n=1 Tax=Acrobeloides nanus TaxID=290746 RepID=A0A914D3N9_9BILA
MMNCPVGEVSMMGEVFMMDELSSSAHIDRERETTELRFMKQRSFEERATQTDPDPLTESVKIIDTEEWHGEAMAALEEIDNLHE